MMTDHSGTPLQKKLGIREGYRCALRNAPKNFLEELGSLPSNAVLASRSRVKLDFILLFTATESVLVKEFPIQAEAITSSGMLWVAWPKKAAKVPTDLCFEKVQRVGLDAGLVDVKICSINDIWSGLKFVYRLRDR